MKLGVRLLPSFAANNCPCADINRRHQSISLLGLFRTVSGGNKVGSEPSSRREIRPILHRLADETRVLQNGLVYRIADPRDRCCRLSGRLESFEKKYLPCLEGRAIGGAKEFIPEDVSSRRESSSSRECGEFQPIE